MQNETVSVEFPKTITVHGARKLTGEFDFALVNADYLTKLIEQAIKVISTRASAQVKEFDDKVKAESEAFAKLISGTYTFGAGGGGPRLTIEDRALRAVLQTLFEGQGITSTDAAKRAKEDNALFDLIRLMMSKGKTRDELPTDEEVQAEVEKQQPVLDGLVEKRIAAIREEEARNEALKSGGLTIG